MSYNDKLRRPVFYWKEIVTYIRNFTEGASVSQPEGKSTPEKSAKFLAALPIPAKFAVSWMQIGEELCSSLT